MTTQDWTAIVEALALIFLAWQQNRILEHQNEIFALQAGQAIPNKVASRSFWVRLIQYWPTLVMLALMALTGYDIYDRHHPGFNPIWALLFFGLTVAVVAAGVWRSPTTEAQSLPSEPQAPKSPSKLVIHWANYRAVENAGDIYQVGDFLRQIIAGDSLVFDIENHNFVIGDENFVPHDPLPFKPKRLQVNYSYGGQPAQTTERREHGRLLLPEDSKIQWLMGENQRLAGEVQRLTTPSGARAGHALFTPLQCDIFQLSKDLREFVDGSFPYPDKANYGYRGDKPSDKTEDIHGYHDAMRAVDAQLIFGYQRQFAPRLRDVLLRAGESGYPLVNPDWGDHARDKDGFRRIAADLEITALWFSHNAQNPEPTKQKE